MDETKKNVKRENETKNCPRDKAINMRERRFFRSVDHNHLFKCALFADFSFSLATFDIVCRLCADGRQQNFIEFLCS